MIKKAQNSTTPLQSSLDITNVMLRFKLRLNVETWGSYKKGDEDYFYIKLLDEQNGLARFPINKQWDIISCEIVNEVYNLL